MANEADEEPTLRPFCLIQNLIQELSFISKKSSMSPTRDTDFFLSLNTKDAEISLNLKTKLTNNKNH